MRDNTLWYAVQIDSEDDWGTGSFSYDEAVKMVKESNGRYSQIAVIENDVCIEEIKAEDM